MASFAPHTHTTISLCPMPTAPLSLPTRADPTTLSPNPTRSLPYPYYDLSPSPTKNSRTQQLSGLVQQIMCRGPPAPLGPIRPALPPPSSTTRVPGIGTTTEASANCSMLGRCKGNHSWTRSATPPWAHRTAVPLSRTVISGRIHCAETISSCEP